MAECCCLWDGNYCALDGWQQWCAVAGGRGGGVCRITGCIKEWAEHPHLRKQ